MLAFNNTLYYLFDVFEVAQTGNFAFRQPEVIEEAIISSRTYRQPRLLIVHLYSIAEDVSRRVPESILIEGYSFKFAGCLQWSIVKIQQDRCLSQVVLRLSHQCEVIVFGSISEYFSGALRSSGDLKRPLTPLNIDHRLLWLCQGLLRAASALTEL